MSDLKIEVDGATLAATYSPSGPTALVALHAAAAGTRDYFLYQHLHRVLPPIGVGVVTFDRRGEGESTGRPSRGDFALQAEDALSICDVVDVADVGLWGISQGGWVAPLAAMTSSRVSFLVLIASIGVTPAEQMRYATAEQLRRAGYGDDVVAAALDLRRRFEDWIHGERRDEPRLRADLEAASAEPWSGMIFLPASLPDQTGVREWIDEMDFDPRPTFFEVQVPTLLFYGADDEWSPVDPSVEAWRQARGDDVAVVVINDASHDLRLADGKLAPEYERNLIAWLKTQTTAGAQR
jgi:uncharacterized protein